MIDLQNSDPNCYTFKSVSADHSKRTISNCLKLKTQESLIDYRPEIVSSQHYVDKIVKSQEDKLEIQSLTRQFELKFKKQQQYYVLKEWKIKQEIQNLLLENQSLKDELQRYRNNNKKQQLACLICRDGEVISHYHKVLSENQQNHKNCLAQKKNLNEQINLLASQLAAFKQEQDRNNQELRNIQKVLRSSQMKLIQAEHEKEYAIKEVESKWKDKMMRIGSEYNSMENKLIQRQKQFYQSKHCAFSNIQNRKNVDFQLTKNKDSNNQFITNGQNNSIKYKEFSRKKKYY